MSLKAPLEVIACRPDTCEQENRTSARLRICKCFRFGACCSHGPDALSFFTTAQTKTASFDTVGERRRNTQFPRRSSRGVDAARKAPKLLMVLHVKDRKNSARSARRGRQHKSLAHSTGLSPSLSLPLPPSLSLSLAIDITDGDTAQNGSLRLTCIATRPHSSRDKCSGCHSLDTVANNISTRTPAHQKLPAENTEARLRRDGARPHNRGKHRNRRRGPNNHHGTP